MTAYPWELPIGVRPWETAAAGLFPRTITIKRPNSPTLGGPVGYQGATEAGETTIASGVICTVQIASSGRTNMGGALPDESPKVTWTITVPTSVALTLPPILEEDRVYDDLGRRFMVNGYEPEPLGGRIDCVRLKS
jgi:hypothetical protein